MSNSLPVVTVKNLPATHFQVFAPASLFTVNDPDGDAIASYAFWDTGTGGGYFVLAGVVQPANQEIDVTAAQLSLLAYESGSGADTLWVRANDGIAWGGWSNAFTVTAPIDQSTGRDGGKPQRDTQSGLLGGQSVVERERRRR